MPYIDIRIEFEASEEEGYTHHSPTRVSPNGSDLDPGALGGIAEQAGQSDVYTVDVSNAMLSALDGRTVTELEI